MAEPSHSPRRSGSLAPRQRWLIVSNRGANVYGRPFSRLLRAAESTPAGGVPDRARPRPSRFGSRAAGCCRLRRSVALPERRPSRGVLPAPQERRPPDDSEVVGRDDLAPVGGEQGTERPRLDGLLEKMHGAIGEGGVG